MLVQRFLCRVSIHLQTQETSNSGVRDERKITVFSVFSSAAGKAGYSLVPATVNWDMTSSPKMDFAAILTASVPIFDFN